MYGDRLNEAIKQLEKSTIKDKECCFSGPKNTHFTLHADTRKGNRPSFIEAARPEQAKALYDEFNEKLSNENIKVETGNFGAMMEVSLVNDGPVTIIIDSKNR